MKVGKVLRELYERAHGRCHYCGIEMTLKRGRDNTATKDHILPRAASGTSHPRNLVCACWACNNFKSDMSYNAFTDYVRRNGRPMCAPGRSGAVTTRRARNAAQQAMEVRIKESDAPWSQPKLSHRPYLNEIGKYPTLGEVLISAGLLPQSNPAGA